MKTIFVVTQSPDRRKDWQVTQREGDDIVRTSYHSSKGRAMASIAGRLTGVIEFAVVIPELVKNGGQTGMKKYYCKFCEVIHTTQDDEYKDHKIYCEVAR